ncbi:Cofactor of BRCA1 [Mortierella polycephala]|uniref:Cofactor of BRCA1 n=1 Tax=Mortierella polycephala TaxID=41804 RepID=A0A9P6PRE1_9FUNG|nr:Cofactor of BRCA1 [Mortierella polycephala]
MEEPRLLGARATEKIRDMLVKQAPLAAIRQLQERNEAIYPLLDHHGKSRYEVHSSCMKALKAKLLQRLETAEMDDARLESILDSMLPYIDVEGLQELPLTLLGRFPDRMTPDIIEKIGESDELFKMAPKEVQRTIWRSNSTRLGNDIVSIVKAYRDDPDVITMAKEMSIDQPTKLINQSVKKLLDIFGDDLKLYDHIIMYLRGLFVQTNEAVYCTLRFDILMAVHEAGLVDLSKHDRCRDLAWNLDACNRTLSMDHRRVENIKKFFDGIAKDDPVHGDIAMILNDPFTSNMITSRLLILLNEAAQNGRTAQSDQTLIWTATMINFGAHAKKVIQYRKYKIPKVEVNVIDRFMTTMSNCILDDTLRSLRQSAEESAGYEEVEFTPENLTTLNDSEVARKLLCHYILDRLSHLDIKALPRTLPVIVTSLRDNSPHSYDTLPADALHVTYESFFHSFLKMLLRQTQLTRFLMNRQFQSFIMDDFLLPCASIDASVHEEAIEFLLKAFRLVASSGRAGALGDAFLNLGRWLEALYVNRPAGSISKDKDNMMREKYAEIVADAAMLSGGRYKMKPEDISNVLAYVQPVWDRQQHQMDTSL